MAADDFMESEVAIAAAATAALLSPRVREVARRGAVYGVAGVLTAGRAMAGAARGAGRGVEDDAGSGDDFSRDERGITSADEHRSDQAAREACSEGS